MNLRHQKIALLVTSLFAAMSAFAQSASSNDQQKPQPPATELSAEVDGIPPLGDPPVADEPQVASASQTQSQDAWPGSSDVPAPAANAISPTAPTAPQGFWSRLVKAYADDWHPGPDTGAAPKYRGYPMPISNPPFPFSVWPIGGTVWIGYPNATAYPLNTALQTGPHGDWWKKVNIQIYGWADLGMNLSTSSARPYGNLPAAYAEVPNTFQLDQATLYIERTPDTVQTDHFDWGFRFTNLIWRRLSLHDGRGLL